VFFFIVFIYFCSLHINQAQNNDFFSIPRNFSARKMRFDLKKAFKRQKNADYQLSVANLFVPLHRFCDKQSINNIINKPNLHY